MQNRSTSRFLLFVLLSASSFFSQPGAQAGLRVMSFNVMCDFCKSPEARGSLRARLPAIIDTINRSRPELISLQEFRNGRQVRILLAGLAREYLAFYAGGRFINDADTVLLVQKDRFEILKNGGMWLGPKAPRFSFGWKFGIPRRLEWVDLKDRASQVRFRFAGAHFDNKEKNKIGTAKLLVEWGSRFELPLILAADTNLLNSSPGYAVLSQSFKNAFESAAPAQFVSNHEPESSEACFLGIGAQFPACRIDHVFTSSQFPLRAIHYATDLFWYRGGYASDHRAIFVDFEI